MLETLAAVRKKVVLGFLGGSDFVKIAGQLDAKDGKPGASGSYSYFTLALPSTYNLL